MVIRFMLWNDGHDLKAQLSVDGSHENYCLKDGVEKLTEDAKEELIYTFMSDLKRVIGGVRDA